MSSFFTYAAFVSCTPLVEFQSTNKINLRFQIPPTHVFKYDRIEIYRHIGEYTQCEDPSAITETSVHTIKVFEAKQQFSGLEYSGNITTQNFFPNTGAVTTLGMNLTALSGFQDDSSGS